MAALRESFLGSVETIERDAHFSITGARQPEWLAPDGRVPPAARAARGRALLAERARVQRRGAAAARRRLPEQAGPTWTLDRIDQAALPLDKAYHYDATGTGVNMCGVLPAAWRLLLAGLGAVPRWACGWALDVTSSCLGHRPACLPAHHRRLHPPASCPAADLCPRTSHPTGSYVLDTGIRFSHQEFRTQVGGLRVG